ncbi:MAG: triose-phosphate isomerase [Patescibacteria group bacterium]
MIFVNFKTYQESTGSNALRLAKIIEEVSMQTGIKIIAVAQPSDIKEICQSAKVEVWSQKIDPVEYGAHTGAIIAEAVVEDGAIGTFLNHSENKLDIEVIQKCIDRANQVGLKTLVFAGSIEELNQIIRFSPTYISYEPAELVGSTSVSVSQSKPEMIKEAADIARAHGTPLIVGAGIHSQQDVKKSIELGAMGIAVATNIVKSTDPKAALLDLVQSFL